jgi:hypothetical protein
MPLNDDRSGRLASGETVTCERYANVGENRWFENPDDQWEDEDATGLA